MSGAAAGAHSIVCDAILFDLDGLLVDSTVAVERQWRACAARNGLDGDGLMRVVHGRHTVDRIRDVAPHLAAARAAAARTVALTTTRA